ncbi:hypothetical protein [Streptomyces platensis]|uniref:hypothetical protein n=1 Tax=Streptomyces platensis TaxID=58346 RepID=UPI002E26C568
MAFSNPNLLPVNGSTFEANSHAWMDATSNTTLSVISGQYLTGTYSLRFTATAAGSVQAYSPFVSGITPGSTYVARVPVRVQTATAGKTFQARVLFYGPTGNDAVIGSATSTVNASATLTGWQSGQYPMVSMVAPAGAARARVSFIGTGLAAAEYLNVDDVYLTTVALRYGELLDYNTSSVESDASGWTVSNGTLSRVSGVLYAGAGYYVLSASSASAGLMDIKTAAAYPVTAGKTYVAYVAAQATATMAGHFNISFYDASAALVGSSELPQTFDTTIQRIAVSGVAPVGAVTAKILVRPEPTAAAQSVYLDDASLASPYVLDGNLLTYEEYSTESILPPWTVTGATASRGYLTSGITEGFYQLKLTPAELGSGIITAQLDRLVPVTPGTTYQVGATIFRHNTDIAQSVTSSVRMFMDWYDADGNLFAPDNPDQFYPVDKPDEWYAQVNTETRECPEGAAFARVMVQVNSTSALVDGWFVDTLFMREATSEYDLVVDDATGCVTLTINLVPATSSSNSNVTILRMDESGKAASMRAYGRTWDLAPNPYSTIVVEDYEAPLGSRVWYSVQWSSSTGATKGARLLTQTVSAPILADADYAWFKSPGVPALNTTVMMEAPLKWSRAARSARYDVVGRKNPVHISGTRAGRTSSITVLIWDPEGNALFDSLLDAGTPALIQAMPGYGIDGNLYVSVGDVDVEPLSPDAREDGWRWTLAITEVDRPGGGLQGSALSTWQDILDSSAYPTWEDLFNAHETWTSVLTEG